ncbi:HTTM domain-containing protein [Rubinisphaera italica]|uniref:Vitamin K-dependent gamma-carboxylase n=1 Tax=Rubinisphaera italica TaxID=2527969 RepID=A0A5C5XLF7_9PLAN|nr:HTTM domain-containing protein [Rubinisphaera italica]TWT63528.1 Vitamin K-dependent gamma-carboxylase [Rubinisphaera italica]
MDAKLDSSSSSWTATLREFFFDRQIPYGMALTRIALSLVTLVYLSRRWPHAREFFSADGAPSPLAANYGFIDFIPLLPGTVAVALYSVLLILLATLMLGWKTRISAWGVFVLFTYFTLQDSLSTITKYSVISSHAFFLLALSNCGAVWSVDRWQVLKRQGIARPVRLLGTGEAVEIWPQRLLQLFLGFVYLGAAITKMHTEAYFSGDQLRFWMLSNVNHYNPLGEIMAMFPAMLVSFGYIAILWEILFIFMVWNKKFRIPILVVGATFHAMTYVTLGLIVFPFVCFSLYLCFFNESDLQWWQSVGRRLSGNSPTFRKLTRIPHRMTTALCRGCLQVGNRGLIFGTATAVLLAVFVEHQMDVYGSRRAEGKYQLATLPYPDAMRMLSTNDSIREVDKLLSFDVGCWMTSGLVTEFSKSFKQGDRILVQATMIPPHGDVYLECNLHDAENAVLDQTEGVLTREEFRYTFTYYIPTCLAPGEYQFVLKSNTEEIARKTIQIAGVDEACVVTRK